MGIRLNSIQSRDQVDIQNTPTPKTQYLREDSPIPDNLAKTVDKYADFMEKKEAAALRNAQNIRSAMVKNKFADFENQATIKVLEAQGENTYEAGDLAGKELQKNIEKEMGKLPPQYRTEYANFAQDSIQRFNKTAQGRMISEGRKAGEEAFKRRSEDLSGRAVLNAYDKQAFETSLQDLDQTVEQHTQLTVGDESPRARELMNIHKQQARSNVIVKTVETLSASGDVAKATEIAQEYKDSLTADDLTKTYKLLADGKVKRDLDTAKTLSDTALATFGDDETAALDFINKSTTDGRLARDATSTYTARVAAQTRAQERQRRETFGDLQTKVIKTGMISNEDMAKLDSRDAKALRELQVKVSRGELIPRNARVWNEMQRMFVEEPSKFSEQTFSNLQDKLPNTDINTLMRMRTSLLDPTADKFKANNSAYIQSKYLRQIKAKPGTNRYIEESSAIRDLYTTAFLNAKANLGERGTQTEIDNAIEEEMAVKTLRMKDTRGIVDRIMFRPPNMQPQPAPATKGSLRFNSKISSPLLDDYEKKDQDEAQAMAMRGHGRKMTEPELLNYLSRRADQGIIKRKSDN